MVNHVTFPSTGNTYSDGSNDEGTGVKFLGNDGHRSNFIPLCEDFLTEAEARIAATGLTLNGTATDNLTVASSGSISFNPGAGKGFAVGTRIRLAVTVSPTVNYMEGVLTAYNQTTGAATATLDNSAGSGSYTAWTISVTGNKGSTGAAGTNGTNGTNGAPGDISIHNISTRTSNTILGTGDAGKQIIVTTGGFTQTFTAAATLGNSWWVWYKNESTSDVIFDPNSSETINQNTTYTLKPGEGVVIQCDASKFVITAEQSINVYKGNLTSVVNGDYDIDLYPGLPGKILSSQVILAAGTATVLFKIAGTGLGSSNSASTSVNTVSQTSANSFSASNPLTMTISSASGASKLQYNLFWIRQ